MDLTAPAPDVAEHIAAIGEAVRNAPIVVPSGAHTHWEVGGDPPAVRDGAGVLVAAPAGAIRHDPADLTVTVGGGTPFRQLQETLASAGQECPLDPREPDATVGGILACGLSGPRRLRFGPLRDRVLEVRFVIADGRLVKGGGPTVKNVSGYDLPRLLVGSLGTLGVIVQATLRCSPLPTTSTWVTGTTDPFDLHRRLFRPSCIAWDGGRVWCLLEGNPDDVAERAATSGLASGDPPSWPGGTFRGRISVRPGVVAALAGDLANVDGLRWMAEVGVGTVHAAADAIEPVIAARAAAEAVGGWMLREAGERLEPFGRVDRGPMPNPGLARRVKAALDPEGRLNPGRLPL